MVSKTAHTDAKRGTVLIVDDERAVVEVLSQMLNRLKYDTIETHTGKDAIAVFTEKNSVVDWVLLDVGLGDMNGLMVYETFKSINPAVQVLFMSGFGEDCVPGMGPQNGKRFLQKPFSFKSITTALCKMSAAGENL